MLKGGGRAFAKKPKDWSFHVPKKMVAKGIKGALSMRWALGELKIIDSPELDWPDHKGGKTSVLEQVLQAKGWSELRTAHQEGPRDRGTLIYLGQETLKGDAGKWLERAARNLQRTEVVDTVEGLKVYDLLRPSRVVMDLAAVQEIVDRFSDDLDRLTIS
jgi:large subunit ribosomal protein L4